VTSLVGLIYIFFTVAVLMYVFHSRGIVQMGPGKTRAAYLRERKDAVYENLRDLNFELKAGKLPESDYQKLRSSLEEETAMILAEIARLQPACSSIEDISQR